MLTRAFRLIWGDDVERALEPLLIVGFAGSLAGSATWTFVGIWAIDELDASSKQLGLYFVIAAFVSASVGYLGGHLSDHLGRRPVILAGWTLTALVPLTWVLVDDFRRAIPLLLLVSLFAPVAMAATQALVADVVPAARHEHAYASLRVANNLGVTLGPPIGGALLLTGNYDVLWIGVAVLRSVTTLLAWRLIPVRGEFAPEEPPARGVVRGHPAGQGVPALPRLHGAREPRVLRVRSRPADLRRRLARPEPGGVGLPRDHQPCARDRPSSSG